MVLLGFRFVIPQVKKLNIKKNLPTFTDADSYSPEDLKILCISKELYSAHITNA
jgi:hypothetical protein